MLMMIFHETICKILIGSLLFPLSSVCNGLSQGIPIFHSCKEAHEKSCSDATGDFRLQAKTDVGYFDTKCYRDSPCPGPGWVEVMIVKPGVDTAYNSSFWTDFEMVSEKENGNKLPSYWSTPLTEICLVINFTPIRIPIAARSLYHLMASGEKMNTNLTLKEWTASESRASFQNGKYEQGVNVGNTGCVRARIGVVSSSTLGNGCFSPKEAIGVAIQDASSGVISTLEYYKEGQALTPFTTQVFVYVR